MNINISTLRPHGLFRRYVNIIIYVRRVEAATIIQKWWKKIFKKQKENITHIIDHDVIR